MISVIIPLYNEEANIYPLFQRLQAVTQSLNTSFELIFVNDGSRDNSLAIAKGLAATQPEVKYIDLSRNFGHQIAVSAGLDNAKGDRIVIIDADLQDPPELIAEMYAKMDEGYEVVYAKRKARQGESVFKKWTALVFYRILSRITSISIPVDTGDYRIMDRKIVEILKKMPEQHKFLRGQISWIGFRQTYVEYNRQERNAGETGYTFKKMLRFALDGITAFSDFPLKLVTYFGFAVSFIAFLVLVYVLYAKFVTHNYVAGWPSLICSILFIGGVQLIGIGIIGEYLSRMNSNIRNRPLYIINDSNVDGL